MNQYFNDKLSLFLTEVSFDISEENQLSYFQNGTIRGFVYDKSSGEPVMFCNVFLQGTTIGAPTDVNGMYNITRVTAGSYNLIVT